MEAGGGWGRVRSQGAAGRDLARRRPLWAGQQVGVRRRHAAGHRGTRIGQVVGERHLSPHRHLRRFRGGSRFRHNAAPGGLRRRHYRGRGRLAGLPVYRRGAGGDPTGRAVLGVGLLRDGGPPARGSGHAQVVGGLYRPRRRAQDRHRLYSGGQAFFRRALWSGRGNGGQTAQGHRRDGDEASTGGRRGRPAGTGQEDHQGDRGDGQGRRFPRARHAGSLHLRRIHRRHAHQILGR